MMPTRLQDGLSVSLLQWLRSACADETREVVVRIGDTESLSQIIHLLENAGLMRIQKLSATSVHGTVTAEALSRVSHCLGVCSVTAFERERS